MKMTKSVVVVAVAVVVDLSVQQKRMGMKMPVKDIGTEQESCNDD